VEGNTTLTDPIVTRSSFAFTTSGVSGTVGFVNVTFPVDLNATEIGVFIDGVQLISSQFPIITSNGTHYFVYFEFEQSRHAITLQYAVVDIAVTNVSLSKTIVGQNSTVLISITLQNQGSYEETFNVTIRVNSTIIDSINVTLSSSNSTTIFKPWDSSGSGYGNYCASVFIELVSGETNIGNNNKTSDSFHIGVPGDIKGDAVVDIFDAILLSNAFNSKPGNSTWNPNTDLRDDGIIDLFDAIILANHYGEHE